MKQVTDKEEMQSLLKTHNWVIFNRSNRWTEEEWDMTERDVEDIIFDVTKSYLFEDLRPSFEVKEDDSIVIVFPNACRLESRGLKEVTTT